MYQATIDPRGWVCSWPAAELPWEIRSPCRSSATVTFFFPPDSFDRWVVILNCRFLPASVWFSGKKKVISHNPHLACELVFIVQTFGRRGRKAPEMFCGAEWAKHSFSFFANVLCSWRGGGSFLCILRVVCCGGCWGFFWLFPPLCPMAREMHLAGFYALWISMWEKVFLFFSPV